MTAFSVHKDLFSITTDPDRLDLIAIHDFLSKQAYWCMGIPFERVQRSVGNSLNFGVYFGEKQIGYARIISDLTTMAYLCDVYILSEFSGQSLGKCLIETVMSHPDLQGLRRWVLGTRDAHGLYEQFGWKGLREPGRWMEK